ncbi:MAG: glycoside hydrolase family 2 protein [Lachnospiraceae bacterium]|nr:glycoside hydrolase family 2 protein [Lachnospiraceae bacterium]
MAYICRDWEFVENCTEEFLKGAPVEGIVRVDIPHTVKELPLQYADEKAYQMISGYRKVLNIKKEPGMRYILRFEGAAHIAEVFVNGEKIAEHRNGYTAFTVDITRFIDRRSDAESEGTAADSGCMVAVRLDSTENPAIPPFGFVIDYLTFGGIYRPVELLEVPETSVEDVFISTPSVNMIQAEIYITGPLDPAKNYTCYADILDMEGDVVRDNIPAHFDEDPAISQDRALKLSGELPASYAEGGKTVRMSLEAGISDAKLWSPDTPYLYTLRAKLCVTPADGKAHKPAVIDEEDEFEPEHVFEKRFGIRTMEFRADGFYLNGAKFFIRGLNRHQNFPYTGYAVSDSLQRADAHILKDELHVNAVRTSHYPQSHAFLDACDELGLLVFTEIPGWQHIGNAAEWRDQAVQNTREMILQYRSHPSIMLWGVRINESVDCDELYTRTNALAHKLDPSRATSGVRYLEKSHLLEDVYAFNDFSYAGEGIAAKPKKKVTSDMDKALLISESNGHMFPTKAWDTWERRQEQALRHAQVMNDAMADGEHAGCFEWCMFDYPTHKDFGSGDRVCYHGVMDYFRNPKVAAYVYSSQTDDEPVLEIGSAMDIGDYNAGRLEKCYVFTNADKVRLYKNNDFVTELAPSAFTALPHGPLLVDDTIGCLLETKEGFTGRKEKLLHKSLNAAAQYGVAGLPLPDLMRMGWCMVRYHMSYEDGVELFGKYVGNWGGEAVVWKYEAIKNGKVVAVRELSPGKKLHLDVKASDSEGCSFAAADRGNGAETGKKTLRVILNEDENFDMSLVRVRVLNEFNSLAAYTTTPVRFEIDDEDIIRIVGPKTAATQGGMTGTIIKTAGKKGTAHLTIRTDMTEPVTVEFTVE